MARLAGASGEDDTQGTMPAYSQNDILTQHGDFENDDTLTEEEKADIRQDIAAKKAAARKVTFDGGDGDNDHGEGGGGGGEDDDAAAADARERERRRESRRKSLKDLYDPAEGTKLYCDFTESDIPSLSLFREHEDGQEEILHDMRDGPTLLAGVTEYPQVMFAHVASITYHYNQYKERVEQLRTEARAAEEGVAARIRTAVEEAEAKLRLRTVSQGVHDELSKRLDRCVFLKNKYAADAGVAKDEVEDLRRRNSELYQKWGDAERDMANLRQQLGNPTVAAGGPSRAFERHVSSSPLPGLPPLRPNGASWDNPYAAGGAAQPAPAHHHSSVSGNLTATRGKLKDIETFRGDDSDKKDYKFWRRSAKNFLARTNIHTSIQDQIEYVIDHLRGPAGQRVEYRSLPGARNAYVSVDEIFEDLNRIYDTTDPTSEATAKLWEKGPNGLSQGEREGFDAWVGRFTSAIAPINMPDHEMIQHAIRLMRYGQTASSQYRFGDTWETFIQNCRMQQQFRRLTGGSNNSNAVRGSSSTRGGRGGGGGGGGGGRGYGRTKAQMDALAKQGQCFKCGGTCNVNGHKHRATDEDAPAACKNGGIVPANRIPCLRATVTGAAAVLDEVGDADNTTVAEAEN